jgi:P-type Ca2+ transporter type 2C
MYAFTNLRGVIHLAAHTEPKHAFFSREDADMMGLNDKEVQENLERYGKNELQTVKGKSIFFMIIDELRQFLNILLIIAAIISIVASGHLTDGLFIFMIVILNTTLSVVQARKANRAVEALKSMSTPHAKVWRNNILQSLDVRELVVGDLVVLEAGDYVPADLRLVETINMKIDESTLTGESEAVLKDADRTLAEKTAIGDRVNMAYASTIVTYGRGLGVVRAVGMKTEIGKIQTMLNTVEEHLTPLQEKIDRLGKMLGFASITVVGLIFVVGLLYRFDPLDLFMVSVSLAVAAIPEGLPTVITVVLALGMRKMANKKAIVKALSAVETLGSVTVIATDKTGTLTQNKMVVTKVHNLENTIFVTGSGYDFNGKIDGSNENVDWIARIGALCNDSSIGKDQLIGDPTELALVALAEKKGIDHKAYRKKHPRLDEYPFDSVRKCMSTLHDFEGEKMLLTKGAIGRILSISTHYLFQGERKPIDKAFIQRIEAENDALASQALRVLAFAMKPVTTYDNISDEEKDMVFIGLVGIIDPPREEVKSAIALCHKAGIRVVMITGDHKLTASAIGKSLGIQSEEMFALSGTDLDKMSDNDLRDAVKNTSIFARVSPTHKVRLVKAFQDNGEITSMTGDGVNDAPALKQASIGVAMGITGTDVAKEASDMILMDDNFTTIVDAVAEGRVIYANIRKFVGYLVSCNVGEVMLIFIAMLLGWGSPLLAIQILWINLVTDSLPAFALGLEPKETDVMNQQPNDPDATIVDRFMGITIAFQSVFLATAVLISYYIGTYVIGGHDMLGETLAFITIITGELLRTFSARSETKFVFKVNPFSNKYVNYAVLTGFVLLVVVVFMPGINTIFQTNVNLSLTHFGLAVSLGLIPLFGGELAKLFKRLK